MNDENEANEETDETEIAEPLPAELGPEILSALARKGYATLTPVQYAVLAPGAQGRDLRITSQTGSGSSHVKIPRSHLRRLSPRQSLSSSHSARTHCDVAGAQR